MFGLNLKDWLLLLNPCSVNGYFQNAPADPHCILRGPHWPADHSLKTRFVQTQPNQTRPDHIKKVAGIGQRPLHHQQQAMSHSGVFCLLLLDIGFKSTETSNTRVSSLT